MQEKLEKLFLIKSTIFESPFMAHFVDLVICLLTNNNNILELSSILAKHLSMYLILNPQSRNPITRLTAAIIDQKMNERNIFFLSFFHEFHVQYQLARLSHDMQDVWKSAKILIILHQLHTGLATYEKGYNLPFFFKSTHSKVGDWTGICAKKDFFIIVYG